MKNALIVVGDELKYNHPFIEYLNKEIEKKIDKVHLTLFISKNDESISKDISQTIENYDQIIIAVKEGFELVGKILSTQSDDTLVLKEGMLLPSKSEEIKKDSYRLSSVNVIKIKEGSKIPDILLSQKSKIGLFLFCKEIERFEKLAHVFEIESKRAKLADGLYYYLLQGRDEAVLERFLDDSREMITQKILLGDDLFAIIANRLIESKKSITFAESCTGGLIASEFTKNSGVSSVFKGSVVSYANEIKESLLNVKKETLIEHGAVSIECVKEMLDGVMDRFDADFSIAVSGVAGPDGGSLEKPVGTVIIGVKKAKHEPVVKKILLKGDRVYIQKSTLFWALKLLVESDEEFFFKFLSKSLDK